MISTKLNDQSIRESLSKEIFTLVPEFNVVVEELELEQGQSRIDLAVFGKELVGIEIKSDCDTLSRLESQVSTYNRNLEKIFIVTGEKYRDQIKHHVPSWWGIAIVSAHTEENYQVKVLRKAKKNPEFNPIFLLKLLWKNEAISLLETKGITKGLKALTKWNLQNKISENFSNKEIKSAVMQTLITRECWKSALPQR